jgi:leucyl aminopeptidase
MKRYPAALAVFFAFAISTPYASGCYAGGMTTPVAVGKITGQISGAQIQGYVQKLQDFGTRNSRDPNGVAAGNWIRGQFQAFGYHYLEEHAVTFSAARNVCAVLPGKKTPEKTYVLGAHYDSLSFGGPSAPGADDNASGTAGMLAVAKAMAKYRFESTIIFCAYANEERGLYGSRIHAAALRRSGINVLGMINLDMIGYRHPESELDIDVVFNQESRALRQTFAEVVAKYFPGVKQKDGVLHGGSSDHESFWEEGFPAIFLFEDSERSSPYIHSNADRVGKSFNSPELAEQIARAAAATLVVLAVPAEK